MKIEISELLFDEMCNKIGICNPQSGFKLANMIDKGCDIVCNNRSICEKISSEELK